MGSSDRGMVVALSLDAIDPRLSADQRATAGMEAITIDTVLAASVWNAILYTLLDTMDRQTGRASMDRLMHSLTAMSLGMLDPDLPAHE